VSSVTQECARRHPLQTYSTSSGFYQSQIGFRPINAIVGKWPREHDSPFRASRKAQQNVRSVAFGGKHLLILQGLCKRYKRRREK